MSGGAVGQLAAFFRGARRIVFLTGAGMSTESGIRDFRSSRGLYASGIREDIFDIGAFDRAPERFYGFARAFLRAVLEARPHAGHHAMVELAARDGVSVVICTQNIDDLHQKAGSHPVHPLHGTLHSFHCRQCGAASSGAALWPVVEAGGVPRHKECGGVMKPDIVFFGELLPEEAVNAARAAIQGADLLVVAGTSLVVYPAAGLPDLRSPECRLVILNQSETPLDREADWVCREAVGVVLGAAVEAIRR